MSAKFYTLLTEIGAAKLASAAALGVPLKITHMAVGDGGGVLPTPSAQQTALVAERRRAALNMLYIDPQNNSQIIAEQVIPETEGGWWIREVGLFDETGALIAVGNCPESYKPQLAEGSGRTQTVRMVLITSSTDNIILKIDPAVVLATRKYVDDKALELKVYVDDLMAKHLAAPDPHSQYAQKDSPTLTGIPKVPTPTAGNSTKQIANTEFVASSIAAMVDSAPAALDTLNELAAALGNDPNFATTMINALAGKQPLDNTLTNLSGKDIAGLLTYLGLEETINRAADALQKSQNGGDIPDKDLFVRNIGAARAFSGGINIGGDSGNWTTAEFITWLESQGAFNHPYWMCKGSWAYDSNKVITDTGCGSICLAGAVVEVLGTGGAITIRVTTPTTTSGGGVPSAQFIYINHGDGYAPGWRRDFSRTGDEMTGNLYLKNEGRINFAIVNEDGTPRMWLFKDKGGDGVHINNGNDGGGDFIFGKDGSFYASAVRAGLGRKLTVRSDNNSALSAHFNLWGGGERPTVIELDDDQGWHLYSQRNPDGSIQFVVNGHIIPTNYDNFDARYLTAGNVYTRSESDNRYVQNIQRGAPVWPGKVDEYGPAEAPAGCFLTLARHDPTTAYGVTFAYRPLQMWVGNGWRTING
ncbi:phage tail protein [Salmonella enterica]|nr:phage tail protein [Salmonella enterica]EKJ4119870.1 phage tail protein [Salmonella enterica]